MPLLRRCLCWRSVRTGSVATIIFSMTSSFIQIILQIALWTGNDNSDKLVTSVHYMIYIPLAALDLLLIILGVLVLMGLEKPDYGRLLLIPWIGLALVYILYEASINVYFFYVSFTMWSVYNQLVGLGVQAWEVDTTPELIVLVVYWGIKLLIYLLGIACTLSCYQELSVDQNQNKFQGPERSFEYPGGYYSRMTANEAALYPPPQDPGHYPPRQPGVNVYNGEDRNRNQLYRDEMARPYPPDPNNRENARLYRLDPNLLQSREDITGLYATDSRRMPSDYYHGRDGDRYDYAAPGDRYYY